jgi:hypothetical protein
VLYARRSVTEEAIVKAEVAVGLWRRTTGTGGAPFLLTG